jgi:uncharacterized integral membrane protein
MSDRDGRRDGDSTSRISPRTVVAGVVTVLLVLFVVLNRDSTEVSFIFFSAETNLWVALAIAGVAGGVAGFLLGRRLYRD